MARFEITAGKPFNTTFVVKENGTTTPITLLGTETGEFVLSTLTGANDADPTPTKVLTKALTLGTLVNGEFNLALTDLETAGLDFKVGFKEDGALFKATHRANVSFYNADGSVLAEAQIPQVFIITEGI